MPHKSKYPDLTIPASNILDFIFAPDDPIPQSESIWHDSVNPHNSLSKSQGLHRIKQLAVALNNLGIKEQEVVMIFTPNHICVPIAYMGIVGSKRIFSGANPIYTVGEIVYQIQNTNAKVLLVHPSLLDTAIAAAKQANLPLNRLFQFNDSPSPASKGVQDWFSILGSDDAANSYQWPKLSPEEARTTIATINYSSGTTGLPKGVMISHGNLIANVMQTVYMRDQEMPYNPKGVYRPDGRPQERWSESLFPSFDVPAEEKSLGLPPFPVHVYLEIQIQRMVPVRTLLPRLNSLPPTQTPSSPSTTPTANSSPA
jgi:4-coumarate--CoA ligase